MAHRIDMMGTDTVDGVVGKLGKWFSLQLHEWTDVRGKEQLIDFMTYINADVCEHILFCKSLKEKTNGEDICNDVNVFSCENSQHTAASVTGCKKRLMVRIRNENPEVKWTHCVTHREALAAKINSPVLLDVLNDSVKVINFIRSKSLNVGLFGCFVRT